MLQNKIKVELQIGLDNMGSSIDIDAELEIVDIQQLIRSSLKETKLDFYVMREAIDLTDEELAELIFTDDFKNELDDEVIYKSEIEYLGYNGFF